MKRTTQKGYAILFTMVIVSVILMLAIGMSGSISKQLTLSSTAKDSQIAFYQADTAAECGLFADVTGVLATVPLGSGIMWSCGVDSTGGPLSLYIQNTGPGTYRIEPPIVASTTNPALWPCFRIDIQKTGLTNTILARGYNICETSHVRSLERGIELTY